MTELELRGHLMAMADMLNRVLKAGDRLAVVVEQKLVGDPEVAAALQSWHEARRG